MNPGSTQERSAQPLRLDSAARTRLVGDRREAWEITELVQAPPRPPAPDSPQRLLIRKGDHWLVVRLADVDWIAGAGNYLELHVGVSRHLYRHTLGEFERRFARRSFVRIHRSTIVNLDRVVELRPASSGCYQITLRDGFHLSLSRRYRNRVFERMGKER